LKKIIIFILLLFSLNLRAQVNLVPNPSFEIFDTCPDNFGLIENCTGWKIFCGSPDYFNACAIDTIVNGYYGFSAPFNAFGSQNPSSGNAYAGLITYEYLTGYREYLGIRLHNSLLSGVKYFVSYKVSLADSCHFATNNIGVSFSTNQFYDSNPNSPNFYNHPKMNDSLIMSDTINWIKIFNSFISDSSYRYLVIGNFFRDSATHINQLNLDLSSNLFGYYYIDDICLSTDSAFAYNYHYDGVDLIKSNSISLTITPNPVENILTLNIPQHTNKILITNIWGQQIIEENTEGIFRLTKDMSAFPNGIYFLTVKTFSDTQTIKFVKQ
jgi:hypothetical protein